LELKKLLSPLPRKQKFIARKSVISLLFEEKSIICSAIAFLNIIDKKELIILF
jgi:hypothetical protein